MALFETTDSAPDSVKASLTIAWPGVCAQGLKALDTIGSYSK